MSDPLSINVADGFLLEFKTGVPYFTHSANREGFLVSNAIRFITSGGNPDYAYNITGPLLDKVVLTNYAGNKQRFAYADLKIRNDVIFGKNDIGDYSIQVVCSDSTSGSISVPGTVRIANSNIPYFLSYKMYTDTPLAFNNIAYFKTGLFGLTFSPRAFFVVQHNTAFKLGLRINGDPNGNIIISDSKKPAWVTRVRPIINDNYWEWSGIVDADRTYDNLFEWEITFKDRISDTVYTEYPSIPMYICVRGKP